MEAPRLQGDDVHVCALVCVREDNKKRRWCKSTFSARKLVVAASLVKRVVRTLAGRVGDETLK